MIILDSVRPAIDLLLKLSAELFVRYIANCVLLMNMIQVVHLMRRFPKQDVANVDLDRRRLKYLSENIAQDISIQSKIRYW